MMKFSFPTGLRDRAGWVVILHKNGKKTKRSVMLSTVIIPYFRMQINRQITLEKRKTDFSQKAGLLLSQT